ncbi:hypothetical protein [Paenisporosarcina sp. NPDC076898]
MKVIKAINHFFIAEEGEVIHWSDYAWFYGSYSIVFALVLLVATSI